jgi:prevent-host-death family protein
MTQTISKSKLKAKMLEIFRKIEADGEELIVTDHGKPVLRITPIREKDSISQLFNGLQGQVIYHEDIDTPTMSEWSEI